MAPERIKSVACVATVQPLLPAATYPPQALPIGSRCETRDRTASIEALLLPYLARLNRPAIALSSAHDRAPSLLLHRTVPTVEGGPLWVHEMKHDGYRLMVGRDGARVRCFTRNGHDWADRFPAIVGALRIKAQSFLIDGEAVITSDDGVSDFCALRKADRARLTRPLTGVNLFREH